MISIGSVTAMTDCTDEEADTRIVVHILYAVQVEEAKTVLVRTVDTDVLVILVGKLHVLKEVQLELDLWLAFGMGRNFRFISVNSICAILGKPRSTSLPVFHALTGCGRHGRSFQRSCPHLKRPPRRHLCNLRQTRPSSNRSRDTR